MDLKKKKIPHSGPAGPEEQTRSGIGLRVTDRKLGNEWKHWQGTLHPEDRNATAGKRIFILLLYTCLALLGGLGFLAWYLTAPRFSQFHPALPHILATALIAAWVLAALYFGMLVLSLLTGKDFSLRLRRFEISLTRMVPLVLRIGCELGISADRLTHSFVKVRNAVIKNNAVCVRPDRLLILLPRCLDKQVLGKITAFAKLHDIPHAVVAGGERARQEVSRIRPLAVIGVACERDLLSGIRDVSASIPVIGIPNIRPEGPCKNTHIDFREFEKAIQTFLGAQYRLT